MSYNSSGSLNAPLLEKNNNDINSNNKLFNDNKNNNKNDKNDLTIKNTKKAEFEVKVSRIKGRSGTTERSYKLPRDESDLQDALENQDNSNQPDKINDCDVNMNAKLKIAGSSAQEVFNAAHTASFAFHQLVREFEDLGWESKDKEAAQLALAQQFHSHINTILHKQSHAQGSFSRQSTTNLINDWSSAAGLLEGGVDSYIKAVQRILKTDLDQTVTISFSGLNYVSRQPIVGGDEGRFPTIATTLFNLIFGPCLFTGRAVRNLVRGAPPVEYRETPILRDLTGLIKPGRLTLVLGPPGCGKTTFLKAISGKLYGVANPGCTLEGDLRYNKSTVKNLKNLASWVSYTRQSDEHQPLLTTRETLEFAWKCRKEARYYDQETIDRIKRASGEGAVQHLLALKDVEVDINLAILGLSGCADTIIGHENLKGVSGGEKRRVTLGEMLVTGSQIMCCDEISTGLDSAATFDITAFLRSAAHTFGTSIIVALLQPPPEVLDLFDDIIVLAEGRIIYHGARDDIDSYFCKLGFAIPPGKDLGDFIVELPTKNGLEFQLSPNELENLGLPPPPTTAAEFAQRWKTSTQFKNELHELESERNEPPQDTLFDHDNMPQNSPFYSIWITLKWSMVLRLRDKVQIAARIIANLLIGGFFGTLFYQLKLDDWWLKAMLFAMVLIFLVSTAFPTVQLMSKQKDVFYKHVEANFYSSITFTFSQFVVGMPFVAFDVACFGTVMYWMCGLAPHAENYVIFLAICISFGICATTMMSLFPFITPNEDSAIVLGALVLILLIVASGALSTESMIPIAFRWMIWVNPLAWAYRALAINEYDADDYNIRPCHFEIVGISVTVPDVCGDYFLAVREVRSERYYVWLAVVVLAGFTALFLAIMAYAVAYIRFEPVKNGAIPDEEFESQKNGKKKPSNEQIRNFQNSQYLDAVSPRSVRALSNSVNAINNNSGNNNNMSLSASNNNGNMPPLLSRSNTVIMNQKTLAIRDLWYTIPINGEPIDFLKGVSFWASPGRMTALMGSSGAGKTTLMDVIAGRKTVGWARGEILVNGAPKIQHEFVKYTGYVEQFGVHAHAATVEESLQFSADLRLPKSTTDTQKRNFINESLKLLELDSIKGALAGTLSMEQNKRLTLGVELVANPSIIFCDEPTSGLDARAAAIVMRVLLKVARSGRTVVCTIHQPSTAIFNFFDDLLLLKRGGEVVYFGELGDQSKHLIQYMQAVPGTRACPSGYNPATWMLEVIGAGTGAGGEDARKQVDFAAVYRRSALKIANDKKLDSEIAPRRYNDDGNVISHNGDVHSSDMRARGISSPAISPYFHENADPMALHGSSAATGGNNGLYGKQKTDAQLSGSLYVHSQWTQIKYLLSRNLKTYWRSPEFSLNRILVVMLFTSIFAAFFYNSQLETVSDLEGRIVNIFFFSSLTCIYNLYTLVPFALARRALYYRERAANMYSVNAFNWAEGLVEIPYIIVQVATTVPLIYFLTNLRGTTYAFGYFTLMIFEILLLMTSAGLFSASLVPDPLAAQLLAVAFLITLMVFCGIMVPKENLPVVYLPLYYISFFKYSSEGLMATQFYELDEKTCVPDGKRPSGGLAKLLGLCTIDGSGDLSKVRGIEINAAEFVLDDFAKDYNYENRNIDLIVIAAWIVGLRIATFVTMTFVNHQKR